MLEDCLAIIFASLVSALLSEALSWVLVYRTESYKRLKEKVEQTQSKLDRKKEVVGSGIVKIKKSKERKVDRYEATLKEASRDLNMAKMKSMFAVAVTMISLFGMLNSHFSGKVVARLPFEPFSFIQGISHRGLLGQDYYECSMAFLYALCSVGIRSNLQKLLGFTPPKTADQGLFGAPSSSY